MKLNRGYLWGLLSEFLWGSMFPVGTAVMTSGEVSAPVLGMLRYLVAGAAMIPLGCFLYGRRTMFRLRPRDWLTLAALGFVGATLMAWLLFAAQKTISSLNASLLESYVPLLVLLISLFSGRRFSLREVAGILLGFFGTLLVLRAVTADGLQIRFLGRGDLLILLSSLSWAVYTLWGRPLARRLGGFVFTAWTCLFGGIGFLLVALLSGPVVIPSSPKILLAAIYLGLFPAALAYFGWNEAQKYLDVSRLSFLEYFTPLVAAVFGLLFLREGVTVLQWTGIAVIILSARLQSGRPS